MDFHQLRLQPPSGASYAVLYENWWWAAPRIIILYACCPGLMHFHGKNYFEIESEGVSRSLPVGFGIIPDGL